MVCVEPQSSIDFSWTTRLSSADCAVCVLYNSRRLYVHVPLELYNSVFSIILGNLEARQVTQVSEVSEGFRLIKKQHS